MTFPEFYKMLPNSVLANEFRKALFKESADNDIGRLFDQSPRSSIKYNTARIKN